ncbi:MAG TPA: sigma-70 family RNA polymerase sigma factor [Solirubrobacteraceae bacterium]|nr:sigma-70 family RNA polymerase sigma factor [Solirubrobacteraceae bacterium]
MAVVREERAGERRADRDRRQAVEARDAWSERRRIRYADGRRVADRRAVLVPVAPPADLPRTARAHVAEVAFLEALEVPGDLRENVEAVRAIIRFQSGDRDLAELYSRWFDTLYTYLQVTLDRGADVESHVSAVLAEALRDATHAAPPPAGVRAWLFGIAYRVSQPACIQTPAAPGASNDPAIADNVRTVLDWVKDDDLVLLIERRPPAERHVLVLRYFAGLGLGEIATAMECSPGNVEALLRAAVEALDASLAAVTRSPRVEGRHPMGRLTHQTPALRQRRRALLAV